ncbi:Cytidylate kinase [Caulifigura coniformis]|uniref:Cytidylate kinase n=1 Tax=Caulifigura coniformis TaxID=2527983 RepID=A0A517S7B4_9PLAN|nr:(d)CMP kinase [Caulifigura coniformis]QDT52021.1 Cytidylate kinase [Caulifigura coniformis]
MIVTIDGPAGTGKSTAAKRLAAALGFEYLDTGAMYRAVAALCLEAEVELNSLAAAELARTSSITFQSGRTMARGMDVTEFLRSPEVTRAASIVAQHPEVRAALVARQRELAGVLNFVCEGRDQGTVVFPQAECKFFLTASPEERAKRRMDELALCGKHVSFEEMLTQQRERDERDLNRDVAPLRPANDAIVIDTTAISLEEVLKRLEAEVRRRLG